MRILIALTLMLLAALPVRAEDDPLARQDPALVQAARGGDAWASYELAFSLISVAWDEPHLRAALPWYERSRDLFVAQGDQVTAAGITMVVGQVRAGLADYQGALADAVAAERAFRQAQGNPEARRMLPDAITYRALALNSLSRYEDSLAALREARALYLAADPPRPDGVSSTWWNEGMNRESLGEFAAALEAYGVSLAWHVETEGPDSLNVGYLATNIGWVHTRMKNYPEARRWQQRALDIVEPALGSFAENTAKLRINMGLVALGEGRADEAIDWAMRALPFIAANRTQMLADQRWTFELMSNAFAMKGEVERAIFFGKMAVNAQQEIRATNTVTGPQDMAASQAEWKRLYQSLADLLISQGRIAEAQAVLNMEKEEEVFQFLRRDSAAAITQTRALLTDPERAQEIALDALAAQPVAAERELRVILARLEAGTATVEDEDRALALQDLLQAAAEEFDAAVAAFLAAAPEPRRAGLAARFEATGSYQAVLEGLPRPTAILQVAALDHATHLFLTLPGLTLHREVAVPRADVARMAFEALAAIEAVSPEAPEKLQALYQVVFAPVAGDLADSGVEVVMLNLDGFLRYVPFAALHDGQGYLVELFAFALYSPAVPTQFALADRAVGATAGFGVTKAHAGFSALPGVRDELSTIFGGVLEGETALDEAFDERSLRRSLLRKPSILHIASHFSLQPGREDDSFLLLGDGSHLPLSKIRETRALRFQGVDLLTLSACQTARGGDGSEIDGFGATAQLNGAGAVMASLWPVSDAATPPLMRAFYHGLMEAGLDKAEALRQAQLSLLQGDGVAVGPERAAVSLDEGPAAPLGTAHPYFWSPFVLMGNWL